MSRLEELLDSYTPPPVPADLAARSIAVATVRPQRRRRLLPWRRRDCRPGWKRPLLAASAFAGLAFTSAVAATVVSEGRIEIPVVRDVVAAVPIFNLPRVEDKPARVAEAKPPASVAPAAAEQPQADTQGGWRRQQLAERLAQMKDKVGQRRAAGLPTPRADRIEARAKRIVERREAAGKPTPSIEQVEGMLALRELGRMRQLRDIQLDPNRITDAQVARFAERLPDSKRQRFLALGPDAQRQLIVRVLQRLRARRAAPLGAAEPVAEQP